MDSGSGFQLLLHQVKTLPHISACPVFTLTPPPKLKPLLCLPTCILHRLLDKGRGTQLVGRLCHWGREALCSIATVHLCIEVLGCSHDRLLLLLGHGHVAVVAVASLAMTHTSLAMTQTAGGRLQLKPAMPSSHHHSSQHFHLAGLLYHPTQNMSHLINDPTLLHCSNHRSASPPHTEHAPSNQWSHPIALFKPQVCFTTPHRTCPI